MKYSKKIVLAADKFMAEMHLKKHLLKIKKELKKLKKQDIQIIYIEMILRNKAFKIQKFKI